MVGGEIGDGRKGRASLRAYLSPNPARIESALKNSIVLEAVSW